MSLDAQDPFSFPESEIGRHESGRAEPASLSPPEAVRPSTSWMPIR